MLGNETCFVMSLIWWCHWGWHRYEQEVILLCCHLIDSYGLGLQSHSSETKVFPPWVICTWKLQFIQVTYTHSLQHNPPTHHTTHSLFTDHSFTHCKIWSLAYQLIEKGVSLCAFKNSVTEMLSRHLYLLPNVIMSFMDTFTDTNTNFTYRYCTWYSIRCVANCLISMLTVCTKCSDQLGRVKSIVTHFTHNNLL